MVSKVLKIAAVTGVHARPATGLVNAAKALDGKVWIETSQKRVDATSILGVLSLGLKHGMEVTIIAEGGSEEANLKGIVEYIESLS